MDHKLEELSAYMDDLALIVKDPQLINDLTTSFWKYEDATGAKLNFKKCFVLSTSSSKPAGPWTAKNPENIDDHGGGPSLVQWKK